MARKWKKKEVIIKTSNRDKDNKVVENKQKESSKNW